MTAPLCAIDTETTGLHPGRQAYEVALIRREPDGTQREESFFLPIDLAAADLGALRVGRYWDRHPHGRRIAHPTERAGTVKPIGAAVTTIARMTHDAQIIGAVPSFDVEILDRLLREHGQVPAWNYRLRCVTTLTAGHLHRDVGGLKQCADALGIPVPIEHEALADARTALAIWDAVMGHQQRGEVAA